MNFCSVRGRLQDVRATEIDKLEMYACFRPGDLLRAEVVSLGDSRSYFLSTARSELGVVYAKSVEGAPRNVACSNLPYAYMSKSSPRPGALLGV